jgi:melanoma-associated antigen
MPSIAAKSQRQGQATSNAWVLRSLLPEQYKSPKVLAPSRIQSAEEEAAYIGIYTFIIAVIALNGGTLSDNKLRRYLQRMNAGDNMPTDKTDNVLQKLIKQGYIVKTVEKRSEGDEESVTWTIGPRGKVEVGPEALAGFIREVYGESSSEIETKLQASLRIRGDAEENGEDGDIDMTATAEGS